MSWISARAYSDADFVRDLLMKQVEADIAEANRLPASARSNLAFGVTSEEAIDRVTIAFNDADVVEVLRIGKLMGTNTLLAVLTEPWGRGRQMKITARWDDDSGKEEWHIAGGDVDELLPLSAAEVSRALLEPTLFG